MENQYELKNDILIVAYFMEKGGWNAVSKTNFQRVLYFAAVLSPAFLKDYEWTYGSFKKFELFKFEVKIILLLDSANILNIIATCDSYGFYNTMYGPIKKI